MAGNTACPENPDIIKPKLKGRLYNSEGITSVACKDKVESLVGGLCYILYSLTMGSNKLPGFSFLEKPSNKTIVTKQAQLMIPIRLV